MVGIEEGIILLLQILQKSHQDYPWWLQIFKSFEKII
jgi:hypothetical protein